MNDILKNLNRKFDHTNLKQDATKEDIIKLCREATKYGFYSVCINPIYVILAKEQLKGSLTKISSVVSFPLGASDLEVKIKEANTAVYHGADEIDMVPHLDNIFTGKHFLLEKEIKAIRSSIPYNAVLKVIIESGKLRNDQIKNATEAIVNAGADFVKTSTGFFEKPAVEHVKIMAETAFGKIEVKAAGGIKTVEDCQNYLNAGATRLGCSSSVDIIKELEDKY